VSPSLGGGLEYLVEPVEGAGVEQGAGTALAVLPGAFRGAELDVLLGAGERVVQLGGIGAEVVTFGRADEGRALDQVLAALQRVLRAIRKYSSGSLRPCTSRLRRSAQPAVGFFMTERTRRSSSRSTRGLPSGSCFARKPGMRRAVASNRS
jgi:hypothetical protein